MIASAAYYLAAGTRGIVATQSASVGSIGVYIPWMDTSAQYEREGLKPDPIVNTGGDLKALGFGGKLTDAQRTHLQESVDASFAEFTAHILAHRMVPASAMRGQVLSGSGALAANLIDAIGDMATARALLVSTL
jgi:ClpP class serine protease